MANRIELWLKVRDTARWRRDLRGAADDVRDLKDAGDKADGTFSGFLDTVKEWASTAPQFGHRTRIFGFALGTIFTAGLAAIPIIVGLGGALVALAGSFAAATIGAGLLAGALGGVLALGLGSIGLVAFDLASNFQEVNTRFQTWRDAVKAFGKDSTQANTAFKRLMGVVANNGGPVILEMVQAFQELRNEFQTAMQPVTQKLMLGMLALFGAARKLLPTLARFTGVIVDALGPVLQAVLDYLTGAEFRSGLMAIAGSFQQIAGPLGIGVLWFFQGIMRLIVRMLPFLLPLARGFQDIAEEFAVWAQQADLSPFLAHLQSWYNLLKATGGLLVTILSGGADSGKSLVDSLTDVINHWNALLKAPAGQSSMASFFKDAVAMTSAFAGFLAWITAGIFKFGRWALPAFTKFFEGAKNVFGQFMDALAPAKPFWDNILGPFLKGIVKGVVGGLVGAFKFLLIVLKVVATVLGWIGTVVGPKFQKWFEIAGQVVGFIFGGAILRVLSWLGKLSVILAPIGFLFSKLVWPIEKAGVVVGWLVGKIGGLIKIFGGLATRAFPVLQRGFDKIISWLTSPGGLGGKLFDAGVKLWGFIKNGLFKAIGSGLGFAFDVAKAVANAVIKLLNSAIPNKIPIPGPAPDINLPNDPIPMLAGGGVVSGSGSWITGDAGPELNTLSGGRVLVQPLPAVSAPVASSATLDTHGSKRVLVSKVYLRGKQIAEAVADEAEDEAARQ